MFLSEAKIFQCAKTMKKEELKENTFPLVRKSDKKRSFI